MEVTDFDAVLEQCGSFGRYQRQMMTLVIIPTSFIIAMQTSSKLFETIIPDHWCAVPGRENTSYSPEQWKNLTIPPSPDGSGYSKCDHFVVTWTDGAPVMGNDTTNCSTWEYDRSLMSETVATTNDWVCDKEMYSVHTLTISIVGSSLSTLVMPYLADRYTGRRLMFFISVLVHLVFAVANIFATNFVVHLIVRFLSGFSFQCNYQMSYMIAVELMSPDKRALAGFLSFTAWTIGMCLTSVLGWALSDWQLILGTMALLNFYMLGLWWYLPESPRWLLSQRRKDEAADIIIKVAEVNQKSDCIDESILLEELSVIEDSHTSKPSLLAIRHYPRFRLNAFLLLVISGAAFLGYSILLMNINVLPNRYFMNFFLLSLVELPSNVSGWLCVQYLGRRFTGIATYAASIFLSLVAVVLIDHKVTLLVVVGLLKWVLTMGLYVIYILVPEVYPTTLRSTGMGTIAVFGTATTSVVPYIIKSGIDSSLNYWIIAGVCGLCLLCSLPLPETLDLPLPQTLPEAETIGNTRPLQRWVHNWNLHKYKPVPFSQRNSVEKGCKKNINSKKIVNGSK